MSVNVEMFGTAARGFVTAVGDIGPADLDRPGLGQWDVRALVGHTSRALHTVEAYLAAGCGPATLHDPVDYFLALLAGADDPARRAQQDAAVAERGRLAGTELGADPAGHVTALAARVVDLVAGTSLEAPVASPAGTMPLDAYLPTRTLELTVHTLDLCRALGVAAPAQLDPAVAATLELVGRLAARRGHRGDLLLQMLGRGATLSAL